MSNSTTIIPPIPSVPKIMNKVSGLTDFTNQVTGSIKTWAEATKAMSAAADAAELEGVIAGLGKFSAVLGGMGAIAGLIKIFLPNPVMSEIKRDMKIISDKLDAIAKEIAEDTEEIKEQASVLNSQLKIWPAAEKIKSALGTWQLFLGTIDDYFNGKADLEKVADYWSQLPDTITGKNLGTHAQPIADGWANSTDDGKPPYSKQLVHYFKGNIPAVLNLMLYYFRLITMARSVACGHWVIYKCLGKNDNPSLADWKAALDKFKQWEQQENPQGNAEIKYNKAISYVSDDYIDDFLDNFTMHLQALAQGMQDLTDPSYLASVIETNANDYLTKVLIPTVTQAGLAAIGIRDGLFKAFPYWYWTVVTFQSTGTSDSEANTGPAFSYYLSGNQSYGGNTYAFAQDGDYHCFIFWVNKIEGGYKKISTIDYPTIATPMVGKPDFTDKDRNGWGMNLKDWVSAHEQSDPAFMMAFHYNNYDFEDWLLGVVDCFLTPVQPMGTALAPSLFASIIGVEEGWPLQRVSFGRAKNKFGKYADFQTEIGLFIFDPKPANS